LKKLADLGKKWPSTLESVELTTDAIGIEEEWHEQEEIEVDE